VSSTSTPATLALDRAGLAYRIAEYGHDPRATSYGLQAALALGVDVARVHKTLIVAVDVGGPKPELCVGLVPVDAQLDLKAIAMALGAKRADMASVADAERSSGYVVGGVSPIGQRKALRTVVDEEAVLFDTIYVSGGRRGLDIELAPNDLLNAVDGMYARIAKRG
jgi:Cys-tRNA(Pro)/Cys-tRNA(Cys) deacylase